MTARADLPLASTSVATPGCTVHSPRSPRPRPSAPRRERVAIIGSGISGLATAWHLNPHYDITLFEARSRLGGHTHTVDVDENGRRVPVDTGFIVFNERTYPNFCALMERLGVRSKPSDMSFSMRCERTGLEYAGNNLNTLFAQRRNLLRPRHIGMLLDIVRFSRICRELLAAPDPSLTLGQLVERNHLGSAFREHYLEPMASAVWSTGTQSILGFPALTFARFFHNHGFLDLRDRPVWRVIDGGSSRYIEALTRPFADRIRTGAPIERVQRRSGGVDVTPRGAATETFDHVVIAAHSDQALRMLADPSRAERAVLGAIAYTPNDVQLHTDTSMLPRNPRARASWNAHVEATPGARATLTYDQTRLQSLNAQRRYLVTLNRTRSVAPSHVLRELSYAHPLFDRAAVAAQARHAEINGAQRTYFCGAYWGYGFHEDGVNSALAVARAFGCVPA